jgi:pimeloyl-ACP methyl ester carboxylesterase
MAGGAIRARLAKGPGCYAPAMPLLNTRGTALWYQVTGTGVPLVLVHGSAVDGNTWNGVAVKLAQDHRVITYDRRGYGRSVYKPVRDHRVHAQDLTDILEQVAREPAVVVGWSSGGTSRSPPPPSGRSCAGPW